MDKSTSKDTSQEAMSWRGCSLKQIHRNLSEYSLDHMLPIVISEDHSVLFEFPYSKNHKYEPPCPLISELKWDSDHVRLPFSPESKIAVELNGNDSHMRQRWNVIKDALSLPITNSKELQDAILKYNCEYQEKWNFLALHKLFESELGEEESQAFFNELLPRIVRLALQMPELIQAPIPLLKQNRTHSISISQQQVSCLLANAFLCTFPQRNTIKRRAVDPEYSNYPEINFHRLFQSTGPMILEKIKCLLHYFRRVCPRDGGKENTPIGVVTIKRRSLDQSQLPNWTTCTADIGKLLLHIDSTGVIEDGKGLLQVDFANKYLGGGVLGSGCVQEEIRFIVCPELIVSKLFTEFLGPTEALIMVGCEQYSNYSGYSSTFKWTGNHEDKTPYDTSRRRKTHIVAIDALRFRTPQNQYREELMLRELNKAYTGFLHELNTPAPGIATGNWGCGAYRGNPYLKAMLQMMACVVAERPITYYTFGDSVLRDSAYDMYVFLKQNNVQICELWSVLRQFQMGDLDSKELYKFIRNGIKKTIFMR